MRVSSIYIHVQKSVGDWKRVKFSYSTEAILILKCSNSFYRLEDGIFPIHAMHEHLLSHILWLGERRSSLFYLIPSHYLLLGHPV